jgi:hypothetical protein
VALNVYVPVVVPLTVVAATRVTAVPPPLALLTTTEELEAREDELGTTVTELDARIELLTIVVEEPGITAPEEEITVVLEPGITAAEEEPSTALEPGSTAELSGSTEEETGNKARLSFHAEIKVGSVNLVPSKMAVLVTVPFSSGLTAVPLPQATNNEAPPKMETPKSQRRDVFIRNTSRLNLENPNKKSIRFPRKF